MQPRKVGAILTSLGLGNRTRTNSGWMVTLNRIDVERIHHLAECYGIHNVDDPKLIVWQEKCPLCRATAEITFDETHAAHVCRKVVDVTGILANHFAVPLQI